MHLFTENKYQESSSWVPRFLVKVLRSHNFFWKSYKDVAKVQLPGWAYEEILSFGKIILALFL